VVRAVVYRARALGINVFSYLDDTLTFDLDYHTTKTRSYQFADLLTEVGFLLHKDKLVREPTQRILFFGFIIDSNTLTLEIPHDKFIAIQDLVRQALNIVDEKTRTPIHFLAKVVGKLILVGAFSFFIRLMLILLVLIYGKFSDLALACDKIRESTLPFFGVRTRSGPVLGQITRLRRRNLVAIILPL
jgi:hypothetical protein